MHKKQPLRNNNWTSTKKIISLKNYSTTSKNKRDKSLIYFIKTIANTFKGQETSSKLIENLKKRKQTKIFR